MIGTRKPKKLRKVALAIFALAFTLAGVNVASADYTINGIGDNHHGVADANATYQMTVSDAGGGPHDVGSWNSVAGGIVNLSGNGMLTVSGYDGSTTSLTTGIINATGGQIILNNGVLALTLDSSISGIDLTVNNGIVDSAIYYTVLSGSNAGKLVGSGILGVGDDLATPATYLNTGLISMNEVRIKNNATLTTEGVDNVTSPTSGLNSTVKNDGTLKLTGGTLVKGVTGTGSTVIDGNVLSNASIGSTGGITINGTKSLTIGASNLGTTTTNDGKLILTGTGTAGELGAVVTGGGDLQIGLSDGTYSNIATNGKSINQATGGVLVKSSTGSSMNTLSVNAGDTVTGNVELEGNAALEIYGNVIGDVTLDASNSKLNLLDAGKLTGTGKGNIISDNGGAITLYAQGANATLSQIIDGTIKGTAGNGAYSILAQGDSTYIATVDKAIAGATGITAAGNAVITDTAYTSTSAGITANNGAKLTLSNATTDNKTVNNNISAASGSYDLTITNANATSGSTDITGTVTGANNILIDQGNVKFTSAVSGNTVAIGDGTKVAKLETTQGLGASVVKNITSTGTWGVNGATTNVIDADDTWSGSVILSSGQLTLNDRTGAKAISTDGTIKYNQTNGILKLNNTALTLNAGSSITGGTVSIDPSPLVFNNGVANNAKILMEVDDGSSLTIKGINSDNKTTLTLNDDTNIAYGTVNVGEGAVENKLTLSGNAKIAENAVVNSTVNSIIDVNGATASLILDGATGTADTWNGTIKNTLGDLTLKGVTKNGALQKAGGTTYVFQDLTMETSKGDTITGGTFTIGDSTNTGNLTLTMDGTAAKYNITKGSLIASTGGVLDLNNTNTWAANGTLENAGGTITLSGITKSGAFKQDTAGSTTNIYQTLDLASTDSVTKGTLVIGDAGTKTGTLNTSTALGGDVTKTINSNGTLDIKANTTVLDSGDTWNGTVNVNGGKLDYQNATKATTALLDADTGSIDITSGTLNLNNSSDDIAEAVALNIKTDTKLNLSAGSATMNNNDTWTGDVDVTGGTLNLKGVTQTGKLNATSGTVDIQANQTLGAGATINGADVIIDAGKKLTLNSGSNVTLDGGSSFTTMTDSHVKWYGDVQLDGGSLILKNIIDQSRAAETASPTKWNKTASSKLIANSGNLSLDASTVLLGNQDVIKENVNLTLLDSTKMFVKSGADVELNSTDTLNAGSIVELNTGGKLQLNGVTTSSTTGSIDAEAGTLTILGTTTLGNTSDIIKAAAKTTIAAGNTLAIDGATVTLNDVNASTPDDVWGGAVQLKSGTFDLKDSTVTTNGTVKYNQTNGTLTIDNSSLTLNDDASSIKGGVVNLKSIGKLAIKTTNAVDNHAVVSTSDTTANELTIGDGSKTSLFTLDTGSLVNYQAKTTIDTNATLTNASGSTLRLDKTVGTAADTWNGTVINQGTFELTDMAKATGGVLYQTTAKGATAAAQTTVLGDSTTNYFDLNNASDEISIGKLIIGNGADSTLMNVSGGKVLAGADVTLNKESTFTVAGGDVELNGVGASSTLTADVWNGHLAMTGGTLKLSDKFNKTTDKDASYQQSGGTLTIDDSTLILDKVASGDTESKIIGGNVTLNNKGIIKFLNGLTTNKAKVTSNDATANEFTVGEAGKDTTVELLGNSTIDRATVVKVTSGSTLNIYESGSVVNVNANDTWGGTINLGQASPVTTPTLNYDGLTTNGALHAQSGTLNIGVTDAATLNIAAGSYIKEAVNATLAKDSTLAIAGGAVELNGNNGGKTPDVWSGHITMSSGTLDLLDNLAHTTTADANYQQTGGTLTINNSSLTLDENSSSITSNSVVDLKSAGKLIIKNTNNNEAVLTTKDTSANVLTVGDNTAKPASKFTLKDGSDVNYEAVTTIAENATLTNKITTAGKALRLGKLPAAQADSWSGTVINQGILELTDMTKETSGVLTQTVATGDTTVYGTTNTFDMNNATDIISAGTLTIGNAAGTKAGNMDVSAGTITDGATVALNKASTLTVKSGSGTDEGNVTLDGNAGTADDWDGNLAISGGNLTLLNRNTTTGKADITDANKTFKQTGGYTTVDNSELKLTAGSFVNEDDDSSTFDMQNASDVVFENNTANIAQILTDTSANKLTIGDALGATTTSLTTGAASLINPETILTIDPSSTLNVDGVNTIVSLDSNDIWAPDGAVNLTNGSLVYNGRTDMVDVLDASKPSFTQTGGTFQMENATMIMADASVVSGGDIEMDQNASIYVKGGALNADNISGAGLIDSMEGTTNNKHNVGVDMMVYNNSTTPAVDAFGNAYAQDAQAEFTFDLYARTRAIQDNDKFNIAGNLTSNDPTTDATVRIDDFTLLGDIFGKDAPIDPYYDFKFFDVAGTIDPNIKFTATNKLVKTPIAYYGLHDRGNGTYRFQIDKWNPEVFRGQVATVAQYANQLNVDNILFDHVDLVHQNEMIAEGQMVNRYASADATLAPYQYNKGDDAGVWFKGYGNFENIQMSQDLNVRNYGYGSIIGVDLNQIDLGNGWKVLPTIYAAYNGGHQTYDNIGIYENGGQAGVMGTFTKGNFIGSLLAYGGGYSTTMNAPLGTQDTVGNWFAGAATKLAYNIKLPADFYLQPTLFAAYNAFGEQNWSTSYGAMAMHTGMLNGLNVAPGVNLIWNKESFSVYATAQMMFNIMGGVNGTAGNVDLPEIRMNNAYFEYGLGVKKRFKDRFQAYIQATARAGARLGIGLQAGLDIYLGEDPKKARARANTKAEK